MSSRVNVGSLPRVAAVSFATTFGGPVPAQDLGAEQALEEIVVTGTNIRGAAPIGNAIQTLLSGAGLGLSVLNVSNEAPPFIDTGRIVTDNAPESYDAANAIISGRAVALTLSKSF